MFNADLFFGLQNMKLFSFVIRPLLFGLMPTLTLQFKDTAMPMARLSGTIKGHSGTGELIRTAFPSGLLITMQMVDSSQHFVIRNVLSCADWVRTN